MNKKRLSVEIPEEVIQKAKIIAAQRGMTIRELIIEIITNLKLDMKPFIHK